jgi:solute carrier family 8 (sodium/calcium exchanger)
MPVGNLLVSASTLFSGQTFSHISQFAEFLHLKFISRTTFDTIQRQCLMTVVKHAWSMFQNVELEKVRSANRLFRLAGDGRCDSPEFSAKYCTYSLLVYVCL